MRATISFEFRPIYQSVSPPVVLSPSLVLESRASSAYLTWSGPCLSVANIRALGIGSIISDYMRPGPSSYCEQVPDKMCHSPITQHLGFRSPLPGAGGPAGGSMKEVAAVRPGVPASLSLSLSPRSRAFYIQAKDTVPRQGVVWWEL